MASMEDQGSSQESVDAAPGRSSSSQLAQDMSGGDVAFVQRIGRLTVDASALDYRIRRQGTGTCLIFNLETYDPRTNMAPRNGTLKDGEAIKSCFRALGFDCVEMINEACSYYHIITKLKQVAADDHSDKDSLVVVFMSHGERGQLWAYDRNFLSEDLYTPFINCKTLHGKPKMFFIQACRGKRLDPGVTVRDVADGNSSHRIPSWADFLITYSSVEGFYSWRNTTDGSWFIQSLAKVFTEEHHHLDLVSMLTLVNRRLAYEFESDVPMNPSYHKQKQIPQITSMLTRRVYFNPSD